MNFWTKALSIFAYLAIFTHAAAQESPEPVPAASSAGADITLPHDVGAFGAFSYEVPIDLPEFRGLQPNLRLRYNSQNRQRAGWDRFVGLGWTLSGLSTITRVSAGRGIPSFEKGQDIFMLDGMELLACSHGSDINPYIESYPSKYKTNRASASCLSGGNMTTLKERYMKIQKVRNHRVAGGSTFVITRKDGTRMKYESVGLIAGLSSPDNSDLHNHLFQRQWLLTEIRDSQVESNTVRIEYKVDTNQDRFTPRIKWIKYAGYSVEFVYEGKPASRVAFATGTPFMGKQVNRLNYIRIRDEQSVSNIAAYDLTYAESGDTSANLLTRVQKYGSDFLITGNAFSGGTTQPPWVFRYEAEALNWNSKALGLTWDKKLQNTKDHILYLNGRKTEGLFRFPEHHFIEEVYNSEGDTNLIYSSKPGRLIQADPGSDDYYSTDLSLEDLPFLGILDYPEDLNLGLLGVTQVDPYPDPLEGQGKKYFVLMKSERHHYTTGSGDHNRENFSYTICEYQTRLATLGGSDAVVHSVRAGSQQDSCSHGLANNRSLIGNFDDDPHQEIVIGNQVFRIVKGQFERVSGLDGELGQFRGSDGKFWSPQFIETFRPGSHKPVSGAIVVDVDGDGTDDIIGTSKFLKGDAQGFVARTLKGTQVLKAIAGTACYSAGCALLFGDLNGDGLPDAVHLGRDNHDLFVRVALNKGGGRFADWSDTWDNSLIGQNYDVRTGVDPENLSRLVDVNGDGLADLISHGGSVSDVYLSDGTQFVEVSVGPRIADFLGAGDLNGDGLKEIFSRFQWGSIYHQTNPIPNLLVSVSDPRGGRTDVEYAPSTQLVTGEMMPGVQQLVKSITRSNGFAGQERTTSFKYRDGGYDAEWRRSTGFRVVETILPATEGEVAGANVITTIYNRAHYAETGQVGARIHAYYPNGDREALGSFAVQADYYDWSSLDRDENGGFALPLKSHKLGKKTIIGFSSDASFETKEAYHYTPFGNLAWKKEFGYEGGEDDRITQWEYFEGNISGYIVDKPRWKTVSAGLSIGDRTKWVSRDFFSYDARAISQDPVYGNLTKVHRWTGDTTNGWAGRVERTFNYDASGNVIAETDARGAKTTHTYDAAKNLFRTGTTNALSHSISTVWDTKCQVPLEQFDANDVKTTMVYDALCRSVSETNGRGHTVTTEYVNTGNPTTQMVKTRSPGSGGTLETREYFDGFGQVYRSTQSGVTDSPSDQTVMLTGYDVRGNVAWKSLPLTWAEGGSAIDVPATKRTSFTYDPADRVIWTTHADGNKTEMFYTASGAFTSLSGHLASFPLITTRDESCYDQDASTICNYFFQTYDAYGRKNKEWRHDEGLTDVAANGETARVTKFAYDAADRLVAIRDPQNAYWRYTYDSYGNRTVADDPALGRWTMAYDANGNLIQQTDAKNQTIEFEYDVLNRVTLKTVTASGIDTNVTQYTYDEAVSGSYNTGRLTTQRVRDLPNDWYHRKFFRYNKLGQPKAVGNQVGQQSYWVKTRYHVDGPVSRHSLPMGGETDTPEWLPYQLYDAANRQTAFGSFVTNTTYDVAGRMTRRDFGNGSYLENRYDTARGWLTHDYLRNATGAAIDRTFYTRRADGRVAIQDTTYPKSQFRFTYDYAGRLLKADNVSEIRDDLDQAFEYDKAGSMRFNSHVGSYKYQPNTHAPFEIRDANGALVSALVYDANGNMLEGFEGKVMTYDGENRPLTVTKDGVVTKYVYGADGARLKRIDNYGTAQARTTVYFDNTEIREFGSQNAVVLTQAHANVRLENGAKPIYFYHDQLGSIRTVTNGDAETVFAKNYQPFGEFETNSFAAALDNSSEDIGWIGERYDEGAELQYLNARYYDPKLGSFIPADTGKQPHPTIH